MNKILGAAALLAAVALPSAGWAAATAIATTNVNLRAGPSTEYPPVNVVRSGDDVRVYGCLSSRAWCDVSYGGQRGWISSNYLAYVDDGRRYTGARVVSAIGVPVIGFSFGNYWDDHYRGRSFYRDRDRWDRREDRRDAREDRRDDRREAREERREDRRRDAREERREDRRDGRREGRRDREDDRRDGARDGDRRESREDRGEDRRDARSERRDGERNEDRREARDGRGENRDGRREGRRDDDRADGESRLTEEQRRRAREMVRGEMIEMLRPVE